MDRRYPRYLTIPKSLDSQLGCTCKGHVSKSLLNSVTEVGARNRKHRVPKVRPCRHVYQLSNKVWRRAWVEPFRAFDLDAERVVERASLLQIRDADNVISSDGLH